MNIGLRKNLPLLFFGLTLFGLMAAAFQDWQAARAPAGSQTASPRLSSSFESKPVSERARRIQKVLAEGGLQLTPGRYYREYKESGS